MSYQIQNGRLAVWLALNRHRLPDAILRNLAAIRSDIAFGIAVSRLRDEMRREDMEDLERDMKAWEEEDRLDREEFAARAPRLVADIARRCDEDPARVRAELRDKWGAIVRFYQAGAVINEAFKKHFNYAV